MRSALLIAGLAVPAAGGVGTAPGANLLQPIGARATGMGEAYVSAQDDVFGIHYNPGARIRYRQGAALFQRGYLEDSFGALGASFPTEWGRISGTLLYYDSGSVDLAESNGDSRRVTGQSDILATASAVRHFGTRLSIGGNLKYFRSTLIEEFVTSTALGDLGGQWRAGEKTIFGASVANIGPSPRYGVETEAIPIVARAGVSHRFGSDAKSLLAAVDFLRRNDEKSLRYNIGVELRYGTLIALRTGYRSDQDFGSISFGIGGRWEQYSVDYAFIPHDPAGPFSSAHRVGFAFFF